jgi:hypothetical protein
MSGSGSCSLCNHVNKDVFHAQGNVHRNSERHRRRNVTTRLMIGSFSRCIASYGCAAHAGGKTRPNEIETRFCQHKSRHNRVLEPRELY